MGGSTDEGGEAGYLVSPLRQLGDSLWLIARGLEVGVDAEGSGLDGHCRFKTSDSG